MIRGVVYRLWWHWWVAIDPFHPFLVHVRSVADWLCHRAGIHAALSVPVLIWGHARMSVIQARGHLGLAVLDVLGLLWWLRLLVLRLLLLRWVRRVRRRRWCLLMVLTAGARSTCSFRGCVFSRHDVDQEIEHIALGEGRRDIGTLQRAPLVLLRMYPGAHRQLGDEYIAALRKQYRRFGGDHFHLGIRLHDLLYPSERELVNLVVVFFILEGIDDMLPERGQDITVVAVQALGYLPGHGLETAIRGGDVCASGV
jgi:hypothetical protein